MDRAGDRVGELATSAGTAPASRATTTAVLVAVAVTVLAWASAFVAIRAVGVSFRPGPLALGRLLIGAVALGVGMLISRRNWVTPTARDWGLLAVCGVSWFGVYNVALNAAERQVEAGTTAMLVNIGPLLIAGLAGAVLREGFPRRLVLGGAVAFAGAVLTGAATADADGVAVVGVLLCLVAAVTYAVGVLAQKPLLGRLPALQVTWLACSFGALGCLPFTPQLLADLAAAPTGATVGLVYLGVVPTAVAFSTWAYALARTNAGRLGISTYLVPPVTIGLSALLLGELPPWLAVVGGALCLVGVALSRRRPRRPRTLRERW